MGKLTIIKNTTDSIPIYLDFTDNGWSIESSKAVHGSCNSGYIMNTVIQVEPETTYYITFIVSGYQSGVVRPEIGGSLGNDVLSNGTYTQTIKALDNTPLKFYSDGDLSIELLVVGNDKTLPNIDKTIAFKEKGKRWVKCYSFEPDMMLRFLSEYFTFKNGVLYKHNVGDLFNNFYGEQFTSKIQFVSNNEPQRNKMYFTIKLDSNGRWYAPEILTLPNEKYPKGMKSRLKKNNFSMKDGSYWADFLRDINDPNYENEVEALMNGRMMEGNVMLITIENDSNKEIRLKSADIYNADMNRNF